MEFEHRDLPYRHWIVDDAFSNSLIEAAKVEWPVPDWPHWHLYKDENSFKFATKDVSRLPEACRTLFNLMCQVDISKLTGQVVFPDFTAYGAGLHWLPYGGYLNKHLDSNVHPVTGWLRRYSMCLYLNDFEDGALCLHSDKGDTVLQQKANRLVIFECTEKSYHSVQKVINPQGRKSIAAFFWSIGELTNPKRTSAEFV